MQMICKQVLQESDNNNIIIIKKVFGLALVIQRE